MLLRDITERKAAEEAIRHQAQQLAQLNRQLDQRVRERTGQLQSLAEELARVELRERGKLAQMLHDGLQQLLVAARMSAESVIGAKDLTCRQERGQRLIQLLADSITATRSLTLELSRPGLSEQGLIAGVQWLAQWMGDKHEFQINLDIQEGVEPADPSRGLLLFQCVRELLLNAVKHSEAKVAQVRLWRESDGELSVEVSDGGKGFEATALGARRESNAIALKARLFFFFDRRLSRSKGRCLHR